MSGHQGWIPERERSVSAAVVGAGMFGTAVVTQAALCAGVEVRVVADAEPGRARHALRLAGFPDDQIARCDTRKSALFAIESGRCVALEDALLAMDLPLDVVVEATGEPEAGARHASEAIWHGKHVVMVNKEADAVVGPILKRTADRQGVAYLPADGDQHGLLIGLVAWARRLGLEIVCGGKARVGEFVLEESQAGLSVGGTLIGSEQERFFDAIPPGDAARFVAGRRDALRDLRQGDHGDMEELAIVANATGLLPDTELLHRPVLRTREIPEALSWRAEGGILERNGAVEVVTCLRRADEAGLGGGVFLVVTCRNKYSRQFIVGKGHTANSAGTAALILRPYHLCGVETPTAILAAASGGSSGSLTDYRPRVDVVVRAKDVLRTGRQVDAEHLEPEIHPAVPIGPGNALPLRMVVGAPLVQGVPAGRLVTADSVERPADSVLWDLRSEQDRAFLLPGR